jgi:hypothetical protein
MLIFRVAPPQRLVVSDVGQAGYRQEALRTGEHQCSAEKCHIGVAAGYK